VIGFEYASMFAALGVRITIDKRRLLPFVDSEVWTHWYIPAAEPSDAAAGRGVKSLEPVHDKKGERVHIRLAGGKKSPPKKRYTVSAAPGRQAINLRRRASIQTNGIF
jgi:NAD(P) transhydrogenase